MKARYTMSNIVLEGTYGDKELKICRCEPQTANGINIMVLHGVHSCANMGQKNKYRYLAEALVKRGFTPWLVETTRRVHNREAYHNRIGDWITDAFAGKSFSQERDDALIALKEISRRIKGSQLWAWGFSLGGIITAIATTLPSSECPQLDRLILAGSGLYCRKKAEWILQLPILNTIQKAVSDNILDYARPKSIISFRGEHDEIFSKTACIELFRKIKTPRGTRAFVNIPGGNHSLNERNNKPDMRIMDELAQFVAEFGKQKKTA